jgi:hypothetical protein
MKLAQAGRKRSLFMGSENSLSLRTRACAGCLQELQMISVPRTRPRVTASENPLARAPARTAPKIPRVRPLRPRLRRPRTCARMASQNPIPVRSLHNVHNNRESRSLASPGVAAPPERPHS